MVYSLNITLMVCSGGCRLIGQVLGVAAQDVPNTNTNTNTKANLKPNLTLNMNPKPYLKPSEHTVLLHQVHWNPAVRQPR